MPHDDPAAVNASGMHFGTELAWIETICSWAAATPNVESVWIFGSRVTGQRRPKAKASAVPDLDIAYTLRGADPGSSLSIAICDGVAWSSWLQARIPIPIQLEFADPSDAWVWPAVQACGVLIYGPRSPGPEAPPVSRNNC